MTSPTVKINILLLKSLHFFLPFYRSWKKRSLTKIKIINNFQITYDAGITNMADVTALRTQSAGRVYPLKEIRDNYPYHRKTQYDPRVTNSASAVLRGDNSPRRFKDLKENYQQATLINIVASVNNEDQKPQPAVESPSAIDVLSNIFFQRERQISIPKPQIFVEVPQKFSKKKPIFNRISGHPLTEKDVYENRRKMSTMPKARPISREITSTPRQESIKIAVSLQKSSDETGSVDGSKEWISSPAKVKLARSNSPRHRYVTLKKKHERVVTSISTCEAIDILEANESIIQPKATYIASTRDNISSPNQDVYRAKSLPALFPVKRRKSSDSQNGSTEKNSNSNANPFKQTPVKSYGGMPNLLMGKTIQTKSNTETSDSGEETKTATKPSSALNENNSKPQLKEEKLKEKTFRINQERKENITLSGRSIPNPRPSSFQTQRSSRHPETDLLYETVDHLDEKKVVLKHLDKQFEDLRKHISAKMSNLSEGTSMLSESSSDLASYNLVGKAFKSSLSMTSSNNKQTKQKSTKRVTFADDTEERTIVSEKTALSYDNERALLNARLSQSRPLQKNNNKKQTKSLNENEITGLKHKVIPSVSQMENKKKSDFIDNIRISGMMPANGLIRSSSRASDTNRSLVSEADTIMAEEAAREWNGEDVDVTSRDRTEIPLNQGASSFYPNALDDDVDSFESDDDFSGTMESYRVLKAIDLGKLSNYQHRKLKNVSHKHDSPTTHFVKVKVK